MGRIDWKALLIGAAVSLVATSVLIWIIGRLDIPLPNDQNTELWIFHPGVVYFGIIFLPGSIIAGYLHSTDLMEGAIYGVAALLLGLIFPMILFSLLVFGGWFLFLAALFSGLVLVHVVAFGGVVGGILGALLRGLHE